jgi:drug/metabolite transporter (DMT)-like permease
MFYLGPLFVLILAAIFLGEFFTPLKYIGILLLIIGAVLISSKGLKFSLGKAFWLMIASALCISASSVITKYLLGFSDFWTIFAYTRIGAGICLIPVLYFGLSHMRSDVKVHGRRVIGSICLSDILTVVGSLLTTFAISVGSVTLVNALASVQPFFVLAFAVALSIFYPKILKEEIGRSAVALKLIAIAMMFAGVILIM